MPDYSYLGGQSFSLTPDKMTYLLTVLRLKPDSPIFVTDGKGHLYEGILTKKDIELKNLLKEDPKPIPTKLVVCLPKNTAMEWMVEKAVECGATSIMPIVSSRSVVKPHASDLTKYTTRWQTILDAASQQSEQTWRTTISAPLLWKEWLVEKNNETFASFVFISELRNTENEAILIKKSWERLKSASQKPIQILIGPEGGLSDQERLDLKQLQYQELSLGRSVLRVETAAIAALTWVKLMRNT